MYAYVTFTATRNYDGSYMLSYPSSATSGFKSFDEFKENYLKADDDKAAYTLF